MIKVISISTAFQLCLWFYLGGAMQNVSPPPCFEYYYFFLLHLLGTLVTTLCKFRAYHSVTCTSYCVCAHRPKSNLSLRTYLVPFTLFVPPSFFPPGNHHAVCVYALVCCLMFLFLVKTNLLIFSFLVPSFWAR